jgi:hypothetical protein
VRNAAALSARRLGAGFAASSCVVLFLVAAICAASVEIYPGPGIDTYKSTLYTVEVFDGSNWIPAYVYGFTRLSQCHWHYGTYPTVNFLTFGTTGPVNVRVTRMAGPITSVDVSPHSKNIPVSITSGQAVLTLQQNHKAWITINGDDANPLFIFADPPKPPVPAGATYVGPGVVEIPSAGNHYKPANNEAIYIDGGAWVKGNIDLTGTRNVRIMGPGVLSGDLWRGEDLQGLPYQQQLLYAGIKGDLSGNGATVSGITILDTPTNGIWGGANNVHGIKLISPWFFGTDAFPGVSHIDNTFCFNGDEVFMPAYAGYQGENMTVTSCFAGTSNNTVFAGGWWGFESRPGYSTLVDDIDIKTYNNDDWVPGAPLLASAFQVWMDNNAPNFGYSNQTYQNIRIEGNIPGPLFSLKNTVYPWGGPYVYNPPLGNAYNITFKNITLEGTQKYHSEILGWDGSNGFHNLVLENLRINGTLVNSTNYTSYLDVNAFVFGLYDTTTLSLYTVAPCRVVDTRNPPGGHGAPALAAGQDRTFNLAGHCGLPTGVRAVSANVTVTQPTAAGFLTLYPGGPAPIASNINYRAGQTRANNVVLPVGGSGEIVVRCGQSSGTTQFILDVNGYFQ